MRNFLLFVSLITSLSTMGCHHCGMSHVSRSWQYNSCVGCDQIGGACSTFGSCSHIQPRPVPVQPWYRRLRTKMFGCGGCQCARCNSPLFGGGCGTNLYGANLCNSNLCGTNLCGMDLCGGQVMCPTGQCFPSMPLQTMGTIGGSSCPSCQGATAPPVIMPQLQSAPTYQTMPTETQRLVPTPVEPELIPESASYTPAPYSPQPLPTAPPVLRAPGHPELNVSFEMSRVSE